MEQELLERDHLLWQVRIKLSQAQNRYDRRGFSLADATWEQVSAMQQQFPEFALEDKSVF